MIAKLTRIAKEETTSGLRVFRELRVLRDETVISDAA
jgi:hypothetical protein